MSEDNKFIVRRIFDDAFNNRNLALCDELCADNIRFHCPPHEETYHGPEGLKCFFKKMYQGFPDMLFVIDDMIAEGEQVAVRWHTRNQSQHGEYLGLPPTGRRMNLTGLEVFRIVNGKVEEIWVEIDAYGALQQLGIIASMKAGLVGMVRCTLTNMVRLPACGVKHAIREGKRQARQKRETNRHGTDTSVRMDGRANP